MTYAKIPFDSNNAAHDLTSSDVMQFDSSAKTLALAESGTPSTGASALLLVESTTQGVGIPYLDQTQRDAISVPINGLVVLNSDANAISTYSGGQWNDYTSGTYGSFNLDWSGIFAAPVGATVHFFHFVNLNGQEIIRLSFYSVSANATTAAILTSTALAAPIAPVTDTYFTLPIVKDDTVLKSAVIKIATSGVITIGIQSASPLLTQGNYAGTSGSGPSGFQPFVIEYDINAS